MVTALDLLKNVTTVVADTSDFHQIARFKPRDATTNPSLVLKAAKHPDYAHVLDVVLREHRTESVAEIADHLILAFGLEILAIVPGRVSTEVDARLSFDTQGSIDKAHKLIEGYEVNGISRDRVLIKLASTWEGIRAAEVLEKEGIHCNLTLLFSLSQAMACADAGVRLISPFVGRITDWYKKAAGTNWNEANNAGVADPGVRSVSQIWRYYKERGIRTEVMGASFRNIEQVFALAGCDLLTIGPDLLAKISESDLPVPRVLDQMTTDVLPSPSLKLQESAFRLLLNRDQMATEKLAEGIRTFEADAIALEKLIESRVAQNIKNKA